LWTGETDSANSYDDVFYRDVKKRNDHKRLLSPESGERRDSLGRRKFVHSLPITFAEEEGGREKEEIRPSGRSSARAQAMGGVGGNASVLGFSAQVFWTRGRGKKNLSGDRGRSLVVMNARRCSFGEKGGKRDHNTPPSQWEKGDC